MSTRSDLESNRREFVTEILDELLWPRILSTVVGWLYDHGVKAVKVEVGFVIERDLRGEQPPENCVVALAEFQEFVERGLKEGTIEWGGSDFRFAPIGLQLQLMLCNDSDLHFSSPDLSLLLDLSRCLLACSVQVYDSGKLVEPDSWR